MAIKRVIVLTHGINNRVEEAKWLDELKAYLDNKIYGKGLGNEVTVLIHRWNPFIMRFFTFLPVISKGFRYSQITKFQKYIAWVVKSYGANVMIDAVGHSFGTHKIHHAMTQNSSQPKSFYRRVVLIAAAVSSRFKPEDAAGHFEEEHYFYSNEDGLIRISPIGNAGWAGPHYADGVSIFGYEFDDYDHSTYFDPEHCEETFNRVAEILGLL